MSIIEEYTINLHVNPDRVKCETCGKYTGIRDGQAINTRFLVVHSHEVVSDVNAGMLTAADLDQLLAAILAADRDSMSYEQNITVLPTFGGEPVESCAILSWDETRLLVTGVDDEAEFVIIPREAW